jgi:alpha-glucosidase (family GH31 glycosyl hydrolase)
MLFAALHCEWGLVSRDGWALIDDQTNYALDPVTYWWDGPNTDSVDLYVMAYGHAYKQALNDFTLIGGKTAMVPRYGNRTLLLHSPQSQNQFKR